jgi:predicted small lipoprotein YifL
MMNKFVRSGVILLAVLALAACSRNEYSMKGPVPPAPKNAKPAQRIEKQPGTGMNAMPAPPSNGQQDQGQGQSQAASTAPKDAVVKGTVKLPPALAADFKPGETLFVVARTPAGEAAPVAAKKIVVNVFPVEFQLGQEDSMMGSALPANMQILVKLDKDGNLATNDPGDMTGGPVDATLGGSVVITLRKGDK